MIMFARTLNDHVVIGTLVGEKARRHGAECRSVEFKVRKVLMFWSFRCAPCRGYWTKSHIQGADGAFLLSAVILFSKSVGSGMAGPVEVL